MAEADVTVTVKTIDQGSDKMRAYADNIRGLEGTAGRASGMWRGMAAGVGVATAAIVAGGIAAKKLWDTLGEGAALLRTEQRFNKLAQSIGSTADVMTAKLRAATHGTISDMELMANASQIIALRLADTEEQVIRLASVAGTLGWNDQQLILTMANQSVMRLDALGLSVSDVTSKARELELQGMSSQEAFKEAVIQAGEAQKALLDVGDDAVRQMQQAEAGFKNSMDSLKMGLANVATQTGVTGLFADIGYRTGQMGLSDLEKDIKHAAELIAQIPNIQAGGKMQSNPGLRYDFRQIASTDAGRERLEEIRQISDDTQQAIAVLELYRSTMANGSEAAAMLDEEIARLNGGIKQQAEMAALAAAGGRNIAEVYTEWATAADIVGEQAEKFAKTFNSAIEGMSASNVDAGPLITFGEALNSTAENAGMMQFSIESANVALYEAAQAAGASSAELALLGVATGQFTEAEADAALKTAILQEAISRIASDYAEGEISIRGATDALREQIAIISNMPSMFAAAEQSSRQLSIAQGQNQGNWWQPMGGRGASAGPRREVEETTRAVRGYSGAMSEAQRKAQEMAAAHRQFAAAFNEELRGDAAGGLINEAGLVNVEAMNKALMEQAQAAGASATTLALLGVATGQFSEEQAEAALKAAVLQERIMQLAKGIASGEMSMGDALGNLAAFQQNIDQTGAGSLPETVAQLVDSIPADDRTVEFLSSTGLVDDDIRRLSGTVVEIPVRFVTTNDPTTTNDTTTTADPTRSDPLNKNGWATVKVDMNLNFNGPANANDVTRGVRHGMSSWARDLQREGVF